ncbi:unnamed protein product [Closterium sp. NIES-54]
MALPRVLTCLLMIVGVLVSSALPGAEAISEADKQRAVKAGLAFVKAVLAMLFPPPTPAAKFYKADFSDTNVAGTFSIAVPSKNRKCTIAYSIVLVSPQALTPEATISVVDPTTQESIIIPVGCKWAQPRPGVHVCEAKGDFPTTIDTVFSTTSLAPAAAARSAAASMSAAALPGSAVDLVFKVTVASGMLPESDGALRYSL